MVLKTKYLKLYKILKMEYNRITGKKMSTIFFDES